MIKATLKSMVPNLILDQWRRTRSYTHFNVRYFRMFERLGFHILPVNYYSPIPDTRDLIKNKHHWNKETDLRNLNFNHKEQLFLSKLFSNYRNEFDALPSFSKLESEGYGPGYGEIEGFILHSFVRSLAPQKIIEVGSGISTFFSSNALSMNKKEGKKTNLICIEPFPYEKLKTLPLVDEIIEKKVQDVDIDFFQQLGKNDILFVDSSHSVRMGSDVNYLILDVLPSLKKGVLIHIHDIPFPFLYPYPDSWVFERLTFWQEAVLLKALLTNNDNFEIIYCSSFLHFKNPKILKDTFPMYDEKKHFPSSIWLRKIK